MKRSNPRTRYKARSTLDMSRVAQGLKGPGIDTRTWVAFARVDVDPDATVWDAELGWLVDVTIVGGQLDGEPALCRMGNFTAGGSMGQFNPPVQGALVIVTIPEGDLNADCLIVGTLHDKDHTPPTQVNGSSIDEAFAHRTHMFVFPEHDLEMQFERVRITGDMTLGDPGADQPYARGDDLADALDGLADALNQFLATTGAAPPVAGAVNASTYASAATLLQTAIAKFKVARSSYLSTTIRGV